MAVPNTVHHYVPNHKTIILYQVFKTMLRNIIDIVSIRKLISCSVIKIATVKVKCKLCTMRPEFHKVQLQSTNGNHRQEHHKYKNPLEKKGIKLQVFLACIHLYF